MTEVAQVAGQRPIVPAHQKIVAERLDPATRSVEDGILAPMRFRVSAAVCIATWALCAAQIPALAQNKATPPAKQQAGPQVSRITIEVSGGETEAPVENASIYIKYVEERKIVKDKKLEMNVKTNKDGTAHVPDAPMGRALVQVVADGWKTYGRWYDVTEAKQTIKIHLDKPAKWY
jgi:hypothetical protein